MGAVDEDDFVPVELVEERDDGARDARVVVLGARERRVQQLVGHLVQTAELEQREKRRVWSVFTRRGRAESELGITGPCCTCVAHMH